MADFQLILGSDASGLADINEKFSVDDQGALNKDSWVGTSLRSLIKGWKEGVDPEIYARVIEAINANSANPDLIDAIDDAITKARE